MIIALKCIFLFLAIFYGTYIIGNLIYSLGGSDKRIFIPARRIITMTVGIVGFLLLHVFLGL